MENTSKLKTINTVISGVSIISFIAFLLHHYQYINIGIFDFSQKGYFILALVALVGLLISDILEVKTIYAEGKKVKPLSLLIDIILLALLAAFVWYIYTLPLGVCPIRAITGQVDGIKKVPFGE